MDGWLEGIQAGGWAEISKGNCRHKPRSTRRSKDTPKQQASQQTSKAPGTHGTGNTPKFREDTQNASSGDKLVIHIFSQSPNPLLGGWVLKDGGETRVKQLQTSWHACALCRTRVVPDGVHSMFPRIRLHRAEGEETLWNTWGA